MNKPGVWGTIVVSFAGTGTDWFWQDMHWIWSWTRQCLDYSEALCIDSGAEAWFANSCLSLCLFIAQASASLFLVKLWLAASDSKYLYITPPHQCFGVKACGVLNELNLRITDASFPDMPFLTLFKTCSGWEGWFFQMSHQNKIQVEHRLCEGQKDTSMCLSGKLIKI